MNGQPDPLAALTEPPAVAAAEVATADEREPETPDFRESNPFADSDQRSSASSHRPTSQPWNPYAPPTEVSPPLDDDFLPASARVGLPWQHSTSLRSWFGTAIRVAFTPTIAFRQMKLDDDYNGAISFSVYGALGGWLVGMGGMWALMFLSMFSFSNRPMAAEQFGFAFGAILAQLVCGGVGVAIGAAFGALLWAALYHAGLSLVGANRHGFGTTLLVVAFTHGAMLCALPLMMIPFVSVVPWIWSMVVLVIGIREAHQTTTGKAVLSVVLPMVVCGFALSFVVMYRFGVGPFGIPTR